MKKITNRYKKIKYTYLKTTFLTLFVCLLFTKGISTMEKTGDNYFHISINGEELGTTSDAEHARELLAQARRNVAAGSGELTFIDTDIEITGEEVLWGVVSDDSTLVERMEKVLTENIVETFQHGYTLKVNEYMVSLTGADEVQQLLQAAVDKYDADGSYEVELVRDNNHEFNVLTANVVQREETEEKAVSAGNNTQGGIALLFNEIADNVTASGEKDFSDYVLGIKAMNFSEDVEIVDTYLPASRLTSLEDAINDVIKEQETVGEYEVVSGDTLSAISIKVNIPVDDIIEMNSDVLENENSTIRVGQKLIITVPEPELSVERMEENYYEEIYDADIIYIDRDDWYTYQTNVIQQPSAGFRKIVADVYYVNDKEVSRDILKEEILMEAVPKIVERGTKIPPTYIKPISGGTQSSGFGKRTAPTKGASTYHKGIDWSVPTGTAVYASCGGTVAKAGWGSGYGYVVYINHEDGRQTRYGHLSKVLVKVGQTVKQGEKIALSGNTGITTGPHLHFEILINGTQVNPLKYLQ
jgi:murein DD-endopeptidase MepM/ murein hydrolase activator NlpD